MPKRTTEEMLHGVIADIKRGEDMKTVRIAAIVALCIIASPSQMALAQNDVGNFYMGKVKVQVVRSYTGSEALPKAEKIVIRDFAVSPGVITLDESAAGRLHTLISQGRNPDDKSTPAALAAQVQASFDKALVNDLKQSNIETERGSAGDVSTKGSFLVISGEMTAIDEGNKAKRVMVGLGRGASDVQTHVTVTSIVNGRATVVLELKLKSESGKKLGALETMGGGSIALGAAEGDAGDRHSTVQADASRMAKGVAKQLLGFMVSEKWMVASVPAV